MKKMSLFILLCGGILITSTKAVTVHADDSMVGTTSVTSEVVRGDVILKMDSAINFGQKPLSAVVDFGSKEMNYTVTDYSGDTDGFMITAKLTDADPKRSLTIGDVELSTTAAPIVTKEVNVVGENSEKVTATLKYTGLEKIQTYTSTIEWMLTKGTSQIAE
ncbi:MAG: hypothetical protein IC227_01445 [Enterococcus lacertideformus]|uniref:WxL domain-containing protein n=1 Tax=Enterococcus lacertideformus TaxID=2771493 RepID=A0A931F801_9ENTE|nr:hypothetical protein [Enterococcus lacertideformus]